MKFWERISETLTGVEEERYPITKEQKPELLQNNQQCPKLNEKKSELTSPICWPEPDKSGNYRTVEVKDFQNAPKLN
jgi:hypothetical protein